MPGTVQVRLPRPLLQYWDGPNTVDVEAATLQEALATLNGRVPGLAARILDDQGRIRRHVAIFVNADLVEGSDPARVRLAPGDRVMIVPSVSGG